MTASSIAKLPLRQLVLEFGLEKVAALVYEFPGEIDALTLDEILAEFDERIVANSHLG
jgi:hypothetical protein